MKAPALNETSLRVIIQAIYQLMQGRTDAAGTVTLRANETTTVVSNAVIPAGCFPQLTPASATASAEWGNGTIYVSAVANGSFTITHANGAGTTRVVHWMAYGG